MTRNAGNWVGVVAAAWSVAVSAGKARADDAAGPPAADGPLVTERVVQLADPDPAKRDAAQRWLEQLTAVDVPLVAAAAADPATLPATADADARQRLDDSAAYLKPREAVRRRREVFFAEYNAYLLKAALRDYDATADRDPKWDALGRRAIEEVCKAPVGVAAFEAVSAGRR